MVDKKDAYRRARRAIDANKPRDALGHLWQLVDRSHVVDEELRGYLTMMAQAYESLRYTRAAATVALFLNQVDYARRLSAGVPLDLARCAQAVGWRTSSPHY